MYQIPSISLFPGSSSLHLGLVGDVESNHGGKTSHHEEWDKDEGNEVCEGAHGMERWRIDKGVTSVSNYLGHTVLIRSCGCNGKWKNLDHITDLSELVS